MTPWMPCSCGEIIYRFEPLSDSYLFRHGEHPEAVRRFSGLRMAATYERVLHDWCEEIHDYQRGILKQ